MKTFKLATLVALVAITALAFGQAGDPSTKTAEKTGATAPIKSGVSGSATAAPQAPVSGMKSSGGVTKDIGPIAPTLTTPRATTKSSNGASVAPAISASTATSKTSTADDSQPMSINWGSTALGVLIIGILAWVLIASSKKSKASPSGLKVDYGSGKPSTSAATKPSAGTSGYNRQSTPPATPAPQKNQQPNQSTGQPSTPQNSVAPTSPSSNPTQLNMGGSDSSAK